MAKDVVVPFDGSPQSEQALTYALREYPDATVTTLYVIDPVEAGYTARASVPSFSEEWYEEAEQRAERLFDEAREIAGDRELETETEVGRPARTIVEFAGEDADVIVMGSHGRSGVSRILLGSVAETVVRRSPVPVTVVR